MLHRSRSLLGALLLVGVGVVVSPSPARAEEDGSKVYKTLLRSTVWIIHEADASHISSGSGSVIDVANRIVLTNYHVVGEEKYVWVVFPQYDAKNTLITETEKYLEMMYTKKAIRATVLTRSSKVDLALIKLDSMPQRVPVLPLAKEPGTPGQKVYSIGNPHGAMWILTEGTVRQSTHQTVKTLGDHGKEGFTLDCKVLLTSSPTNHGDSGGPLVNGKAELVGVTQGGIVGAQQMSVFIDLSEVTTLLKQAKITPKIGRTEGSEAETASGSADKSAEGTDEAKSEKKTVDPKVAEAKAAEAKAAETESKAATKLRIAKQLADRGFADDAKLKFQEIVDKFPGTNAANEAKELLKKK